MEEEEFMAWLENFLPQLFDETFVLSPGQVNDLSLSLSLFVSLFVSPWVCLSVCVYV